MNRLIKTALLLTLFSASVHCAALTAHANQNCRFPATPHLEAWVDPDGALQFHDIIDNPIGPAFKPVDELLPAKGAQEVVTWFRFRPREALTSETRCESELFLFFGYYLPREFTAFIPIQPPANYDYVPVERGWGVVGKEAPGQFANNTIHLPKRFDPDRYIYIRVADPHGGIPRLILFSPIAYDHFISKKQAVEWLTAGVLLAMMLYNLAMFLFLRDRPYLFFVLYIGFFLVYLMTLWGQIQLLNPRMFAFLSKYIILLSALSSASALWFSRTFLATRAHTPDLDLIIKVLAFILIAISGLDLINLSSAASLLALIAMSATPVPPIWAGVMRLRQGFAPARYFLMGWGILMIGVVAFTLLSFSILPMTLLSFHSLGLASSVASVLLSFALADRIRVLNLRRKQLIENERRLTKLSTTDELTGLNNKRFFFSKLASEIGHARRMDTPLSIIMVDIDHFKEFNDNYGHAKGDMVLAMVGNIIKEMIRGGDTGCRYGGEEFALILPGAGQDMAYDIAERIREKVRAKVLPDFLTTVTISVGVTDLNPDDDLESVLNRAEDALNQAKKGGRDQSIIFKYRL